MQTAAPAYFDATSCGSTAACVRHIVIGIAAVIAMNGESADGSSSTLQRQRSPASALDNLLVMPGPGRRAGGSVFGGSTMTLTPQDCDAIHSPRFPTSARRSVSVHTAARSSTAIKIGCPCRIPAAQPPAYFDVRTVAISPGRLFPEPGCPQQRKSLRHRTNSIQKPTLRQREIRRQRPALSNISLRVVGVLGRKRAAACSASDQDDVHQSHPGPHPNTASPDKAQSTTIAQQSNTPSPPERQTHTTNTLYPQQHARGSTPSPSRHPRLPMIRSLSASPTSTPIQTAAMSPPAKSRWPSSR